jgi:hypothetical protein
MKQLLTFLLVASLASTGLHAQLPEIINTRLSLSAGSDTLIVDYELTGTLPAFNVSLQVFSSTGKQIQATSVTGDIGDSIPPGPEKRIFWHMKQDDPEVEGTNLWVTVVAQVPYQLTVTEESSYFPWLFIASATAALGGAMAWYKANDLYDKYPDLDRTDPAEQHHRDIKLYDNIRNVAFGAAAALGVAATVVHIRKKKSTKPLAVSAMPAPGGGMVAIRYNF